MGIYGNINKLTLLEYCINEEQNQLNTMLPSLNEITSLNEGNAWQTIKTVFGKIKKFFGFLKEKISAALDKISVFIKRLTSNDEHKPINTHYSFSGKAETIAKNMNIEYKEYNIDFIIKDLKSEYLKSINDLWDSFLSVVDTRLTKKNYNDMKAKTEELCKETDKFGAITDSLSEKYKKDSKDVAIPCIDGLSKAAIMHNNWFAGIKTILHDLELHKSNLEKSRNDLDKWIKNLEDKIAKNNDNGAFKDELGNEVDLKDICILLTKWLMYLNKIIDKVISSIKTINAISEDIEKIPGKVDGALVKIKYHTGVYKNQKKSEEPADSKVK